MDSNEKNRMREEIGEFIDLKYGRFTDEEMERLHDLVQNRDEYDGMSSSYTHEYKTFDSEDTYRVNETNTYTFRSDENGIHVDHETVKDWDDGQHDSYTDILSKGRDILNVVGRVFRK